MSDNDNDGGNAILGIIGFILIFGVINLITYYGFGFWVIPIPRR
jgi:hypothetical protein